MKKFLVVLLMVLLAFSVFSNPQQETPAPAKEAPAQTKGAAKPTIKNPDTFIYASHGTIDSLDPAKAYDNASGGIIQNIYDTLVDYDGQATDKFVPVLATEVPTVQNGGISADGKVYRFKIRKGVKFHNGNDLTAEDVRYTFLRGLVTECDAGPFQLLFYPIFFGEYSSKDGKGNLILKPEDFNRAVKVDGDTVVFTLKNAFPPFLALMSGYWAGIIDKEWSIQQGAWDGTTANWQKFNGPDPGKESLYGVANGTGPFKLDRFDPRVETVLVRNEAYWGKKPAMAKAIYKAVEEFSTRKLMLLQGDADVIEVDPQYQPEMDKEKGLTVLKGLKALTVFAINFNFNIEATDNPLIGSAKLDGKGIPANFFSDINVRKGFQAVWNEDVYINDILNNSGVPVATPVIAGLPYHNPDIKYPAMDMKKAEEYFRKAWGGKLWETGFTFDGTYNAGNDTRMAAMTMLSENLRKLNPKFVMNVRGIEWAEFVNLQKQRRLAMFYIGWGADYPDPDNFVDPYMHSQGIYGGRASYNNPEVDRLIAEGKTTLDPARRKAVYYRLQEIWLDDVPGIVLSQAVRQRYFKDWVKGYMFHPMENEHKYSLFSKEY